MYWLIALLLVAAVVVFAGCRKPRDTQQIDGGTRNLVDTDAPKTIESTEITSFYCKFSTRDLMEEDSCLAGNVFTLSAAENSGSLELRYSSEKNENHTFIPTPEFFEQLQQIVSSYNFAQHNGQYYTVGGLPPDYGAKLEIRYASGESIQSSNNQDCFLPLEAMEELVELFQNA